MVAVRGAVAVETESGQFRRPSCWSRLRLRHRRHLERRRPQRTGSKTLVLNDVFVPAHRLLSFADTTSGKTPGAALMRPTHLSIPMLSNIPVLPGLAAVARRPARWRTILP